MRLSKRDRLNAIIAMRRGSFFERGNVMLFTLKRSGKFGIQKKGWNGPVITTKSWRKALTEFERLQGSGTSVTSGKKTSGKQCTNIAKEYGVRKKDCSTGSLLARPPWADAFDGYEPIL